MVAADHPAGLDQGCTAHHGTAGRVDKADSGIADQHSVGLSLDGAPAEARLRQFVDIAVDPEAGGIGIDQTTEEFADFRIGQEFGIGGAVALCPLPDDQSFCFEG